MENTASFIMVTVTVSEEISYRSSCSKREMERGGVRSGRPASTFSPHPTSEVLVVTQY